MKVIATEFDPYIMYARYIESFDCVNCIELNTFIYLGLVLIKMTVNRPIRHSHYTTIHTPYQVFAH